MINEKGLPRRSWYKHQIYAPGFYTGYGVKTLPGIREGIEERNWKEAQDNIEMVAKTIDVYTEAGKAGDEYCEDQKRFLIYSRIISLDAITQALLNSLESVKGFDKEAFEKVHESGEQVTSIR